MLGHPARLALPPRDLLDDARVDALLRGEGVLDLVAPAELVLGEIEIERGHGWRSSRGICTTAIVTIPRRAAPLGTSPSVPRTDRHAATGRQAVRPRASRRRADLDPGGDAGVDLDVELGVDRRVDLDEDALAGAGLGGVDHLLHHGAAGTRASEPDPPGSFSGAARFRDVGDAVLELGEHVVAVVDAQAVAGAQVLVDPHPHEGARYRYQRPGTVPSRHERDHRAPPDRRRRRPDEAAHVGAPDRRGRRPVGLAARPRRSRHDRLPRGRERLRRRVLRPATPTRSRRCSPRSSRGSRRPTSRCPVHHGLVVRHPHDRGRAYPVHCRGRSIDDAADGDPRLQRRGRRPRVLRRPRRRPVARPHAARLVERHRRRRALHAARPRPGHRRRPGRRADRHVVVGRGRLVERRRVAVLRPPRRGDAAVPDLAPPPRHAGRRRRARASRRPTSASSSASSSTPQRAVDRHHRRRSQHDVRGVADPGRRPDRRAGARAAAGRARSSTHVDHWGDRSSSSPTSTPPTSG